MLNNEFYNRLNEKAGISALTSISMEDVKDFGEACYVVKLTRELSDFADIWLSYHVTYTNYLAAFASYKEAKKAFKDYALAALKYSKEHCFEVLENTCERLNCCSNIPYEVITLTIEEIDLTVSAE